MVYQKFVAILTLLLVSYGVQSEDAVADNENGKPAVAQEKVEKPEEKLICKRVKVKGSNFKKKICKTKAQIKYDRKKSKDVMDKIHSSTSPSGN